MNQGKEKRRQKRYEQEPKQGGENQKHHDAKKQQTHVGIARIQAILPPTARRLPGRNRVAGVAAVDATRLRRLQAVGVLSGVTAGAWLGAAEAPTKLVTLGIPPVAISFVMVMGVFLARWSLPALLRGTAGIRTDLARTPHHEVWRSRAGSGRWRTH